MNLQSKYESVLDLKGLKPETKKLYLRAVKLFVNYAGGPPYTREDIISFINSLDKASPNYRRWVFQILRGFFESVNLKWPFVKGEIPKGVTPKRPHLTIEKAEELLNLAKGNPIHYAMLRLVARTGMRKRELRELKVEDYKRPFITINTLKGGAMGGKTVVRELDDQTCDAIENCLKIESKYRKTPYLFVTLVGTQYTDSGLAMIFRRYADKMKLPKGVGWHSLRRGNATWLYKAGMRERELQELMGWETATMPSIYVRLEQLEVDKEAVKIHPFGR